MIHEGRGRPKKRKKVILKDAQTPFPLYDYGEHEVIKQLRGYYPNELGYTVKNCYFPYVGFGEVMFDIMCSKECDAVYASDTNIHLRNAYDMLRDYPTKVIAGLVLEEKKIRHCLTPESAKEAHNDAIRRYEELAIQDPQSLDAAVLYILIGGYIVDPYKMTEKRVLWVASELLTKVRWVSTAEMLSMLLNGVGVDAFAYVNYDYATTQTDLDSLTQLARTLDVDGTYLLYSHIHTPPIQESIEYNDSLLGVSHAELKYRNKYLGEVKHNYYIEMTEGASIYEFMY